jgi:hypothetical protein
MKIGKPSDDRIIVTIKKITRDNKTEKIKYETFESLDVFETTPEAVYKVIHSALSAVK